MALDVDYLARSIGVILSDESPLACFIYGSVAEGTQTTESDLDCFIVTSGKIEPSRKQYVRTSFVDLQKSLGFHPDPLYPVEIFSLEQCYGFLRSSEIREFIDDAWRDGDCPKRSIEDDSIEVLRAMVSTKLPILGLRIIQMLEDQAWNLLEGGIISSPEREIAILSIFGKELKCGKRTIG